MYESLVSDIVNEHGSLKIKVVKTHGVPYMNEQLRKPTNVRNMFRRKYDRIPNRQTRETYRKQRNKVIKVSASILWIGVAINAQTVKFFGKL